MRNEDPAADLDRFHGPQLGAWTHKAPVPDPDFCCIGDDVDFTHEEAAGSDVDSLPGEGIVYRCLRCELGVGGGAAIAAQLRDRKLVSHPRRKSEDRVGQAIDQDPLNDSKETIFRRKSDRSSWSRARARA